jgi:FLVCR family MFS transporter 7
MNREHLDRESSRPWVKMTDLSTTGPGKDGTRYREDVSENTGNAGGEPSASSSRGPNGDEADDDEGHRAPGDSSRGSKSNKKWWGLRRDDKRTRSSSQSQFKVYKRRWFGLAQLVLLNIVVSWDVSFFQVLFTLLFLGVLL